MSEGQASYLLSGSMAYDTILLHDGRFHQRILPQEIARLNVAFGIDGVAEEFGGTGGNIAYNAALLGDAPLWVASAGALNAGPYMDRLAQLGLDARGIAVEPGERVANAWIMTDLDNNQITGFHPGAMRKAPPLPDGPLPGLWHLAPDMAATMLGFARRAMELGAKYFLDPGQALPSLLEKGEAGGFGWREALEGASGLFVNEYEALLLAEALGSDLENIFKSAPKLEFAVRTRGGEGSELLLPGEKRLFKVARASCVKDPTGCGDAFRAGFVGAVARGLGLEEAMARGSVMGSFAVECSGGQSHAPDKAAIEERLSRYKAG